MKTTNDLTNNIILVLISSFFALLLIAVGYEIWCNVNYYTWKKSYDDEGRLKSIVTRSKNDILLWELRPNTTKGWFSTNRFGFRDYDYKLHKQNSNTVRICFIGDSVLMGWAVPMDKTFVKIFEQHANSSEQTPHIEALNFGVHGYSTKQIKEQLTSKVIKFEPDKVVYMLCMNDFCFRGASGDYHKYFRKPKIFIFRRLQTLFRYGIFRVKEHHILHYNAYKDEAFSLIREMKNLLDRQGKEFYVVLIPVFPQESNSFRDYPIEGMHNDICRILKDSDIQSIDLLPFFKSSGFSPTELAVDNWHLTEKGHLFISELLLQQGLHNQTSRFH